jgi:hypothetical protein
MDELQSIAGKQKFPWRGKFKSKQEIDNYFSGDKVLCLLCGKWFKSLHPHLIRIHDVGAEDYREKYGLPWKHGLCGKATSHKLSNPMNKRRENGFAPDTDAAREKSIQAKKRPDQPYFIKVKTENLKSVNDKRKKYFDEDYQRVLVRMLQEKKGLNQVCKDDDMPNFRLVSKYAKRNMVFKRKLEKTYAKLPFSVQAGACRLPEDKFKKKLISLQQSGLSIVEIARQLGVSKNLIRSRLDSLDESGNHSKTEIG